MLLIGRSPTAFNLFCIYLGDCLITTFFTIDSIYLGQSSLFSTLTFAVFFNFETSYLKVGIFKGTFKTVATSLAIPNTLLQSGLFAVTPISKIISFVPITSFISVPSG